MVVEMPEEMKAPPQPTIKPLQGILIDASTSEAGWSKYGSFMKCPHLYSMKEHLRAQDNAPSLIMGSLGHLIQAHHRAIKAIEEWGEVWIGCDPKNAITFGQAPTDNGNLLLKQRLLLTVPEAVDSWCERNPSGWQFKHTMMNVFNKWRMKPDPIDAGSQPIAIETQIRLEIGLDAEGRKSLFVKRDEVSLALATIELPEYEPLLLNKPGHKKHGQPIMLSRRLDLAVIRNCARVIVDHKHTSMLNPEMAQDEYAIDGGFQAFDVIGTRLWGDDFGGTQLNLIERRSPFRVETPFVRRCDNVVNNMARRMYDGAHALAELQLQTARGERKYNEWPDRVNEAGPCKTKYGKCLLFEGCITGDYSRYADDPSCA